MGLGVSEKGERMKKKQRLVCAKCGCELESEGIDEERMSVFGCSNCFAVRRDACNAEIDFDDSTSVLTDDKGRIDKIVAEGIERIHLEYMSDKHVRLILCRGDQRLEVGLWTKGQQIRCWVRPEDGEWGRDAQEFGEFSSGLKKARL